MDPSLQVILDSLDDPVVTVDELGRAVFANEAAATVFALDHPVEGQPAKRWPGLAKALEQVRWTDAFNASSAAPVVRPIEGRSLSGQPLSMEALVTCSTAQGRKLCTIVFRDASAWREMEQAVYQARKHQALGALATGIAHDFNNLLTAILSHLDLALCSAELPASLKDNLQYARTSARRGAELVSKLQLFNRHPRAEPGPLELPGVIEQAVFILRRSIDPRILVRFQAPAERPWLVTADLGQLLQLIINLGLNAREAMPNGGELSFHVRNVQSATEPGPALRKGGEFVRLTVSDTGPGMSAGAASRLLDSCFTGRPAGHAIAPGLSIVRRVVEEYGGWLEVESQVGRGTQFHLFLPRAKESARAASARAAAAENAKSWEGTERVLVVDDEEQVRMVIRAVLAFRGYQVVEAADGEDAVQKCLQASPRFDLVLMDLHMPRMGGHEALRRIARDHPGLKAILLTGGVQDHETAAELPGVRLFNKPFENHELLRMVRETLDAGEVK